MKSVPVFEFTGITLTISVAEAERALDNPSNLQSLIATSLVESRRERKAPDAIEAGDPPDVAPAPRASTPRKALKAKGKSKQATKIECAECGALIVPKFMNRHLRSKHNISTGEDASADAS